MPYNEKLADRLRETLAELPRVEEKKMFRGVAFLVNGKMCVNVSGDELMCRFDPVLHESVVEKPGFRTMIMKGRELKGYGYVSQEAIHSKRDFDFWINLCLDFNSQAKASKKARKKKATIKPTAKKAVKKVKRKKK
jgi:TfoX/Sxy family transcriptional regulator of competence genes